MSESNANGRIIFFDVSSSEDGMELGRFLKSKGVSRHLTAKLKRQENGITLNGAHARTCDTVRSGDRAALRLEDSRALEPAAGLYVPVAYEDEDAVVFDKPVNMPVHPSHDHRGDTLGNCFSAMYPGLSFRPVNRLDKNTSGLCAVAKNAHAANLMQGNVSKVYFAAVCGEITKDGVIDAPVGRQDGSVITRCVRQDGQKAVTEYTVLKTNGKYTLLRIVLHTGRTHQIRVHFSYIGFPLAGDELYGGDTSGIKQQALHCGEMSFVSPVSGKHISLRSPLRKEILELFP